MKSQFYLPVLYTTAIKKVFLKKNLVARSEIFTLKAETLSMLSPYSKKAMKTQTLNFKYRVNYFGKIK